MTGAERLATDRAIPWERILRAAPDRLVLVDDDGRVAWTNGSWRELTPEALEGRRFVELVEPADRDEVEARLARVVSGGLPDRFELVLPEGAAGSRRFELRLAPVAPGPGRGGGVVAALSDVTERELAEERLRESEERYRFLSESISDVIFTWEIGRGLTYVSPSVEPILGRTPEEIRRLSLAELVVSPPPETFEETFRERVLADGTENGTVDVELRRVGGGTVWCEIRARILRRDDSDVEVVLGVARDLSAWKEKQDLARARESRARQARRLEALGQLAGGIAHDFNNLLTVVTGNAGMIRTRLDAGDPLRPFVEEIAKAAANASELTRQLLTFARKQPLAPRSVDLRVVVREAQRILRRLIREDVRLELEVDPGELWVEADPVQLEQVLFNLAVNAVDAMPGGRGAIRVDAGEADADLVRASTLPGSGRWIRLSVTDTGVGIAPEIREKIFEPFFTTKEGGRGTGLGLSTVYGIVQQAGGEIRVESELGKGSRFDVFLPAVRPGRPVTDATELPREPRRPGATILLVEDEPGVRRLAREVLVCEGFEVVEAADGEEALARWKAERERIDAVLTDVVMPGMSGVELAERLTDDRPDLPVLYMSGHSDRILKTHGRNRRESSFLAKPFEPETLVDRLRGLLDE